MSISIHIKKFPLLTNKYSKLLYIWTSPKCVCFLEDSEKVLCMCWLWHLLFPRFIFYKTRFLEIENSKIQCGEDMRGRQKYDMLNCFLKESIPYHLKYVHNECKLKGHSWPLPQKVYEKCHRHREQSVTNRSNRSR